MDNFDFKKSDKKNCNFCNGNKVVDLEVDCPQCNLGIDCTDYWNGGIKPDNEWSGNLVNFQDFMIENDKKVVESMKAMGEAVKEISIDEWRQFYTYVNRDLGGTTMNNKKRFDYLAQLKRKLYNIIKLEDKKIGTKS